MATQKEIGLSTLLAVKKELGLQIDDDLLIKSYEIEKKYQFEQDRTYSLQALERLINHHISSAAALHNKEVGEN